jgi:hypothetical protein
MRAFGRCGGGGRRSMARAKVPLAAILTTLQRSRCAAIVDLSCTGARLRGYGLPATGEDLELKIESVRVFGAVVWTSANQCGVRFDEPLMPFEVERLRQAGTAANLTHLSVQERLALDEWLVGAGR